MAAAGVGGKKGRGGWRRRVSDRVYSGGEWNGMVVCPTEKRRGEGSGVWACDGPVTSTSIKFQMNMIQNTSSNRFI
jgi:hypothetical protein